jgi:hypothetical protein
MFDIRYPTLLTNSTRKNADKTPAPNEAVLRDGGSNLVEKAALNCKFIVCRKFIVSRHLAKPLGR